jgi:predicted nuclease with TOPRIM domain
MTKRNQSSRTRIPCEDLRSLGITVAETTTNVRLLSESQARTDQAISRLTEAMSTMAQHDGRLNHLEAEAARCHEHSTRLWQEVKDLRADTNKGIGLAETALERGKNQSFTLRQIIPWGTAIIMAGATVGLLLQG